MTITTVKVGNKLKITGDITNDVLTGSTVLVNIINGAAGDDTITGGTLGDVLIGGAGNDKIYGDAGADSMWGGGGNDALYGGIANDILFGDGGDDRLDGGAGNDAMTGGTGNDTYYVESLADTVTETAAGGIDSIITALNFALPAFVENIVFTGTSAFSFTGNALDNTITGNTAANTLYGGDGNDIVSGGDGADGLYGGNGTDALYGGNGNDRLSGGSGNDALRGDAGNDRIFGDAGDDRIYGGAGSDYLAGGKAEEGFSLGNDTFVWLRADVISTAGVSQGLDHIADFATGDKLDFTGLALGTAPVANLVHVTDTAAGTVVAANFGGTIGFVDVAVLDGVHHLTLAALVASNSIIV